jgi:hypothetical protein
MENSKIIQCRWCGFKALKHRKIKSGKTRGPAFAFQKMKKHVEYCHSDEPEAVRLIENIHAMHDEMLGVE